MKTLWTNVWADLLSSDVWRQVIAGLILAALTAVAGAVAWVAMKAWRSWPRLRAAFAVARVVVNGATHSEHISLRLINSGADPVHLSGYYLVDYPNLIARLLRIKERTLRMPQELSDEETYAGGTTRRVPFQLRRGLPREVYLGQDSPTIAFSRRPDVFCVLEQADGTILRARKVQRRES